MAFARTRFRVRVASCTHRQKPNKSERDKKTQFKSFSTSTLIWKSPTIMTSGKYLKKIVPAWNCSHVLRFIWGVGLWFVEREIAVELFKRIERRLTSLQLVDGEIALWEEDCVLDFGVNCSFKSGQQQYGGVIQSEWKTRVQRFDLRLTTRLWLPQQASMNRALGGKHSDWMTMTCLKAETGHCLF